jgi:hypothetical protein
VKIALLTNLIEDYTGHINVGDVFIRFGLQHILEQAIPEPVEWCLISRFKPLTPEELALMKTCDYIVYGGMPQYNNLDDWKFYYDDEIWDDINALAIPVLKLAGGGGYPSETMTPEEFAAHLNTSEYTKEVLHKTLLNVKLVTTRDKMAQAFLESNDVKSTLLPCSGTFACRFKGVQKTDRTINAICLTASYFENRPDMEQLVEEFKKTKEFLEIKTGKPCLYFAQVKKYDLELLKEWFGNHIVHVDNALDIIDYYKHIEYCVTTRLHFGLPVHGIGGKVVLVRVDTRAIAGEEIGIPVIPLSDYTHDKFLDIFENDGFSKIAPEESLEKEIRFYKEFFKK